MRQNVFSLNDRKKILYVLFLFSVLGNIIDIVNDSNSWITISFNTLFISLAVAALILNFRSKISTTKSFALIVYALLLNILVSWAISIVAGESDDLSSLRSIVITCILLPISGFLLGKKHSIAIGSVIILFAAATALLPTSNYLHKNLFFLVILITGYTYGIYTIISILEKGFKNERRLLTELESRNKDIIFINKLSFKLANFAPSNNFTAITLRDIKSHTGAKLAVFCEYSESQQALLVKAFEGEGAVLKSAIKIGGKKILSTVSPVSPENYRRITSKKIEKLNSFTELTFGAIPEPASLMLKQLTGISNIYVLAIMVSGKLYGTAMLAFSRRQEQPTPELLKSYSHLIALTLRRSIAEKALVASENQLRRITDNISDVVFTTDLHFNTQYISPSIFKLTGESPEDYTLKKVIGKHPIDSLRLIKSALSEEMEKENNPTANKNRTRMLEVELYKKDGTKIDVSTHLSFIRNNEGKHIGFQGITRNITERKNAEAALLESRKKLNTVVETIPDLLFHFDRYGRFVNFYQTSKTHQLFIKPNEFIGKSIYNVFEKPLADKIQKAINRTLHKNSYEFEYEFFQDEVKHFHARCAQLNENEIIIISSDISKIKKSEIQLKQNSKELKQLNADKDRFMQILAHDLKNPFNVLMGFSDLLLRNYKNYDDNLVGYYLEIIKNTSERTYTMLEELLTWSKAQSGKIPFEPSQINLTELVNSLHSEAATIAQRKNIAITHNIPNNLQIVADSNMIKTVIRNLISNAIKFSRQDGQIKIGTHINSNRITIEVADNGIGMSQADQERLWNNSNPHTTAGTNNEKGTGLGLLLCKDFVEKHGGKIWVESEVGLGSVFKIQLPLLN
ncbi:MAG: PAS domain S-box protein [Bacteroidales bacterium]|nr:PAS domain S-box protein [Bacteroidales bacterium]